VRTVFGRAMELHEFPQFDSDCDNDSINTLSREASMNQLTNGRRTSETIIQSRYVHVPILPFSFSLVTSTEDLVGRTFGDANRNDGVETTGTSPLSLLWSPGRIQ